MRHSGSDDRLLAPAFDDILLECKAGSLAVASIRFELSSIRRDAREGGDSLEAARHGV
jgi:hypothetical protein